MTQTRSARREKRSTQERGRHGRVWCQDECSHDWVSFRLWSDINLEKDGITSLSVVLDLQLQTPIPLLHKHAQVVAHRCRHCSPHEDGRAQSVCN